MFCKISLLWTQSRRNNCSNSFLLFNPSSEVILVNVFPGIEGIRGNIFFSLSYIVLNSEYLFSIVHDF